jgi:hypothetical protein
MNRISQESVRKEGILTMMHLTALGLTPVRKETTATVNLATSLHGTTLNAMHYPPSSRMSAVMTQILLLLLAATPRIAEALPVVQRAIPLHRLHRLHLALLGEIAFKETGILHQMRERGHQITVIIPFWGSRMEWG